MEDFSAERSGATGSEKRRVLPNRRGWIGSIALLLTVFAGAGALAAWKHSSIREAEAAAASQPEQVESITAAVATEREYRPTATAIGTVLALQSVTLRNELAGTVRSVALTPGRIVEAGTVLVALDVSVEQAELKAAQARADLAETLLARAQRLIEERATTQTALDRARAERDVALADIARARAVIARKTIRAPFRARVGIADVHVGQYLQEGTLLTTLQGVGEAAHVDFTVAQRVAAGLGAGDTVGVLATEAEPSIPARIVAIDARVDPSTRNATIRARIARADDGLAPGASVRVLVPAGAQTTAVVVPVSALRKGPGGDHVFVIASDDQGKRRVHQRPVTSGAVLGDEVLILHGLEAGEQVATSGSFKLREAVQVAVANDSVTHALGSR
jgi:membrane fusion protein (multidrug efflux system)